MIGHSTGGLLAEMLAGRGLSAATVAIDPGVFRGVLPLPFSVLKGVGPFLLDPRTRRAIPLTFDQFEYGWANALLTTEKSATAVPMPAMPVQRSRKTPQRIWPSFPAVSTALGSVSTGA